MPPFFSERYPGQELMMFQQTLRELLEKRMVWTDFRVDAKGFHYAVHATRIGWFLIKHLWPAFTEEYCMRIQ